MDLDIVVFLHSLLLLVGLLLLIPVYYYLYRVKKNQKLMIEILDELSRRYIDDGN